MQPNFCCDATETEITACCSWSQEQGWDMIALSPEKRLPWSRPVWCVVTEVSCGSVRGILLEKTSCLRALSPCETAALDG